MLDSLAYAQSLPKKRLGAGCLCFNERGQILLVKPVYKSVWEIPGGVVELDESPQACCEREMREELGLERDAGALLGVDYLHATQDKTEALMFIFDGGVLSEGEIAAIRLPPEELSDFGFFGIDSLPAKMSPALQRRVLAAWRQSPENRGLYLENQEPRSCL